MNLIQAVRKKMILQSMHILLFFQEEVIINNSKCISFGFYLRGDLFNKYYVTRESLEVLYGIDSSVFWTVGDFLDKDDSIKDIVIVPASMTQKGAPDIVFKDNILSMNPTYLPGLSIEEQAKGIIDSFDFLPVNHLTSAVQLFNEAKNLITGTSW